jgi:FdhE protein
MSRTTTSLRTDDRLSAAAIDPAWQRWIDLVELAVAESRHPAWSGCVHAHAGRSPESPLVHGATLRLNGARTSDFTSRLAEHFGIVIPETVDPLALILIGVERDGSSLESAAGRLGASVDTVAILGQLCALPLLFNTAGALGPEASRAWQRGYCPVCGAWPSMVEMRGIQRERRMRCGCCGSDWLLPVLRCAFCDEIDHRKLGSLLSEGEDQQVRLETCSSCHGYLKSVTTLGALSFPALAVKDMSTVAFDLAAHHRGYARPARPGWALEVVIVQ